jgi:hypothetical protein
VFLEIAHRLPSRDKRRKVKPDGGCGISIMVQPGKVYLRWEEFHDDTKRLLSLSGII